MSTSSPATSTSRASASRILVALGVVLFAASMLLPAITVTILYGTAVPGVAMLILGPASLGSLEILGGRGEDDALYFVAWLANPLFVAAMYLYYRRARSTPAALLMVAALAVVAVATIVLYVQPDASGYIWQLEFGAFVWAASLVAAFAGTSLVAFGAPPASPA